MNTSRRPWVMRMQWLDLAFLNWRVPAELLARTLPIDMELDTFAGEAWISVVPFRMAGVAPRFVPDVPGLSAFNELNVRTYVKVGGVPGVWFYSLDAAHPLAVALARRFFFLPYLNARMWLSEEGETVRYASLRTHAGAPAGVFAGAYQPYGPEFQAQPGTLDDWLTNRLYLYSASQGRIYRGRVQHDPWTLRAAHHAIARNTLLEPLGLVPQGEAYALYSRSQGVRAWWLERVY